MILTRHLFLDVLQRSFRFGQKARPLRPERLECGHSTDKRESEVQAFDLMLRSPTKALYTDDKD